MATNNSPRPRRKAQSVARSKSSGNGQPYAAQVRADLAEALRDPDASAMRLKVLARSLLEVSSAPNGIPTTTHTLRYSPANEKQMNKVWSRCVVDLIYDMRDAEAPFDVFVQVRPIQSRKRTVPAGAKAKGGVR